MNQDKLLDFYEKAKKHVISNGFENEIRHVEQLDFEKMTPTEFYLQYCYVVFNTGMKNQIAENMYEDFLNGFKRVNCGISDISKTVSMIRHPGKRKAIHNAYFRYEGWFETLKEKKSIEEQLEFLETLDFIGLVTKFHLARNIGLDVAKPDRHLVRIAEHFDMPSVREMCEFISGKTGDRVGVVDVILWRNSNLNPNWMEEA